MNFDKFLDLMNLHINVDDPDNKKVIIDNYWYDVGFLEVQELLNNFSNDDWIKLEKMLPDSGLHFKRNLAYCLEGSNVDNELKILFKLLEIDDEELTEICIDSLRDFSTNDIRVNITNRIDLKTICEKLLKDNKKVVRQITIEFMKQHNDIID